MLARLAFWYNTASLWIGRFFLACILLEIAAFTADYLINSHHAHRLLTAKEFREALNKW